MLQLCIGPQRHENRIKERQEEKAERISMAAALVNRRRIVHSARVSPFFEEASLAQAIMHCTERKGLRTRAHTQV